MCGLYGFCVYGNEEKLQLSNLNKFLAKAAAVRGTDAVGFSYVADGKMQVQKEGTSAYAMKNYTLPKGVKQVIGHTRNTTRGAASKNYNNHPFTGRCGYDYFTLAHNGVLDSMPDEKLPATQIETDSYWAVQVLERHKTLDMAAVKTMAETVSGMFAFTILSDRGETYIVKHDSPLTILHLPAYKMYIYASTEAILMDAIMNWGSNIVKELMEHGGAEFATMKADTIIKINPDGTLEHEVFTAKERTFAWSFKDNYYRDIANGRTTLGYGGYDDGWSTASYSPKGKSSSKTKSKSSDLNKLVYMEVIYAEAANKGLKKDDIDFLFEVEDPFVIEDALFNGNIKDLLDEWNDLVNGEDPVEMEPPVDDDDDETVLTNVKVVGSAN